MLVLKLLLAVWASALGCCAENKLQNHVHFEYSNKFEAIIKALEKKIQSYQEVKGQNFTPIFKWEKFSGLFESNIRANVDGGYLAQKMRNSDETGIYDNNMFASGWIVAVLLDAVQYGKGVSILNEDKLNFVFNAIHKFHDKNQHDNHTTPIMTFWPQTFNATCKTWQSTPTNVRYLSLMLDNLPWNAIENELDKFHLKLITLLLASLRGSLDTYLMAFQIPPDFDDTYLNVGLGATLKKMQDMYPGVYDKWSQRNQNMDILVKATAKYSYDPFSDDPNKSVIDPRTYFFARPFLLDAKKANQTKLSLITTWIQNIDEQRTLTNKGVSMPFNLNNVDVTVCANSIYGIASAAIYDVNGFQSLFLQSEDIQQTFLNTTKFISWAIKTNYTNRPDLAQVYYPSNYNFLWYASRTLFLLSNDLASTKNPIKDDKLRNILVEARDYLQDIFETVVTDYLKNKAKYDRDQSELYFDDFLGLNDTNIFLEKKVSGDDRLFSTSQAINILIATWTLQNETTQALEWKTNTPSLAKYLIDSSVKWLQNNIFNKKLKPLNAFFSGSVKGYRTLPFWYPVNFAQYFNGTDIKPSELKFKDVSSIFYGVKGVMNESMYEQELRKTHFGQKVPIDFNGYNTKFNLFPFWSSKPYTYATALLALSQYNNIADRQNRTNYIKKVLIDAFDLND